MVLTELVLTVIESDLMVAILCPPRRSRKALLPYNNYTSALNFICKPQSKNILVLPENIFRLGPNRLFSEIAAILGDIIN